MWSQMMLDDQDIIEMRMEQIYMRQQRARLFANPDCRDPDHPGCRECEAADDGLAQETN
jgi:hypothetical protein